MIGSELPLSAIGRVPIAYLPGSLARDGDNIPAGSAGGVLERALRRRAERQAIAGGELVSLGAFAKCQTAIDHPDLLVDEGVGRGRKRDARAWRQRDFGELQSRVARR